jgi:peptidoglycan/LPS O-acetylase OafA/YrhL
MPKVTPVFQPESAQVDAASPFVRAFGTMSLQNTIDGHNNNYTLIRLVLAASVIYFHSKAFILGPGLYDPLGTLLFPVANVGGLAVQIFFFLSGLFVAQSYAKDPNLVRFVLKRFFRIWPGLFVCLVLTAIAACLSVGPSRFFTFLRLPDFYEYIVRNSLFDLTWNIPGVFGGRTWSAINGAIHTLPLEVKMYVILAATALTGMLNSKARIAAAAVFLLIFTIIPSRYIPALDLVFTADYSRAAAAMFMGGVLAFGLSRWIFIRTWQCVLIAPALLLTHGQSHVVAFYLAVIWLTLFLGQISAVGKLLRPRADLSYGVYIYGWPMQQLTVSAIGLVSNQYELMAISLVAAMACAFASWTLVEKPSIRLGHRIAGINLRFRGRGRRRVWPTSYETGLGCVLAAVFVACVVMLWLARAVHQA